MTMQSTSQTSAPRGTSRRRLFFLVAVSLAVLASACSKTVKYNVASAEAAKPVDQREVKVLSLPELSSGEYKVLTNVFVRHKGGILLGKGADDIQETLVKAAASLGADAVVGFKYGTQDDAHAKSDNSRWGTALAVKRAADASREPVRSDIIVALCGNRVQSYDEWKADQKQKSSQVGKDAPQQTDEHQQPVTQTVDTSSYEQFKKDSLWIEKTWSFVVSAAEYQLAKRGYYALTPELNQQNIDAGTFSKYLASDPSRIFGGVAGHVMFVDLGVSRSNAGVVVSASTDVKATLYSYGSAVPVWNSSARKSGRTWGLLDNLLGGWLSGATDEVRSQEAAVKTVNELFKTLKPID
jgi:hypothetical protein